MSGNSEKRPHNASGHSSRHPLSLSLSPSSLCALHSTRPHDNTDGAGTYVDFSHFSAALTLVIVPRLISALICSRSRDARLRRWGAHASVRVDPLWKARGARLDLRTHQPSVEEREEGAGVTRYRTSK